MNTILVTGGLGYIGRHLIWSLYDQGYSPLIVDNLSTGSCDYLPPCVPIKKIDFSDKQQMEQLLRRYSIQLVIHLAAKTSVEESQRDAIAYYEENTGKVLALLQSMIKNKVKHLIFSSTAAIYASQALGLIDENATISPKNPYGLSKWLAEQLIQDISQRYGINTIILRYFNVIGADPNLRTGDTCQSLPTSLIKRLIYNFLRGIHQIEVFGHHYATPDGTALRDYVHVTDIASAHLSAINYFNAAKHTIFDVFNVGYGQAYSVGEVIDRFERLTASSIERCFISPRVGDTVRSVADSKKIQSLMHWKPFFLGKLDDCLQSELAWARKIFQNKTETKSIS